MGYISCAWESVQDIVDQLNEREIPLDQAEFGWIDSWYGEIELQVTWESRFDKR